MHKLSGHRDVLQIQVERLSCITVMLANQCQHNFSRHGKQEHVIARSAQRSNRLQLSRANFESGLNSSLGIPSRRFHPGPSASVASRQVDEHILVSFRSIADNFEIAVMMLEDVININTTMGNLVLNTEPVIFSATRCWSWNHLPNDHLEDHCYFYSGL
jgi:hypothetical protein